MSKKVDTHVKEVGHIVFGYAGVIQVRGLSHVFVHETLLDESGKPIALVIGFKRGFVEAVLFENTYDLSFTVYRSHRLFSIADSRFYAGRVVDGRGLPADEKRMFSGALKPVFTGAPTIIQRKQVRKPLTTGIKVIDTTLPIGHGQRELIIGDGKLGKSTIAIDTVLHQRHKHEPVYCVYVAIGQKHRMITDLVNTLRQGGAFGYTTVVATTPDAPLAMQYLAPFVGATIAEAYRDRGKQALVIYDDFSTHAKVYRSISLLLGRPPGRESYPGDIFSLHATLLERAGIFSDTHGGGSVTALPIAYTVEGDISAYVPTNLISITDGQIYLERSLFKKGFIPAVNVGLSVSRVGSHVQPKPLKAVTSQVRLALAQVKELQKMSQLDTKVSRETMQKIHRGELVLELLKQHKHKTLPWEEQVMLFYAVENGYFDELKKDHWAEFEDLLLMLVRTKYPHILTHIHDKGLDAFVEKKMYEVANDFKHEFVSEKDIYHEEES